MHNFLNNNFNLKFENDHLSDDGYKSLKEQIVVKVQERDMKKGTTVDGENTCFAFKDIAFSLFIIMSDPVPDTVSDIPSRRHLGGD